MMTDTCSDCLFCETIEDEDYMACQARQMLVMPFDQVCDFFEERGCICKECADVTKEPKKTENSIPKLEDQFTNTTCDCDYCNANSYPEDEDSALTELLEDLESSYLGILETAAALGEGGRTKDVLLELIGMEVSIGLFKRYLLEWEDM